MCVVARSGSVLVGRLIASGELHVSCCVLPAIGWSWNGSWEQHGHWWMVHGYGFLAMASHVKNVTLEQLEAGQVKSNE